MGLITNLQTDIESEIEKVCDNYCKYSQECTEYCDSLYTKEEKPRNELFENCPLMGLIQEVFDMSEVRIELDGKLMSLFRDKYMEYMGIDDEAYCPDDSTLLVVAINDCIDSMSGGD